MIQAEDRAHRIGQDAGCVNIHYLVGADTLDVLLFRKLNEKQNIVSTTLDNKSKDLNVTKIKEQVGDFINMNGKKVSIDSRKNISQIVDKSNINIMNYISSKSNQELSVKSQIRTNNTLDVNNDKNINIEEGNVNKINDDIIKNINIHESNGRRSIIDEEEKNNIDSNNDDIKEIKKKKRKGKKNGKGKNKTMNNKEEKKENEINEEDKKVNLIKEKEKDNDTVEERKEIENEDESSANNKLFEEKAILDIFDFNNL